MKIQIFFSLIIVSLISTEAAGLLRKMAPKAISSTSFQVITGKAGKELYYKVLGADGSSYVYELDGDKIIRCVVRDSFEKRQATIPGSKDF